MAEREESLNSLLSAEHLAMIRQAEEGRRDATHESWEENVVIDDDERLLDVADTIRAALDRIAALGEDDRKDRRALRHSLAADRHDFANAVAAKFDEFREQVSTDVSAQLTDVREHIGALQGSVSAVLDRLGAERDADRTEDKERHESVLQVVANLNDRLAGDLSELRTRLEDAHAHDLEQLRERIEKGRADVLAAVAARSERDADVDTVLADGRSRLDAIAERVEGLRQNVDGLGAQLDNVSEQLEAASVEHSTAVTEAGERLCEAIDRVQVGTADGRERWGQQLMAALGTVREDLASAAEEQDGRISALTDRIRSIEHGWRADLERLGSRWESERAATVEAVKALLVERHDELGRILADQRGRLDVVDERVGSIVDGVRTQADTLEARLDVRMGALGEKLEHALNDLKDQQTSASVAFAAKIDEGAAALSKAESRLEVEAAEERTKWRAELVELLDAFGHGFRLMSEDQERRLQQGIHTIRADLAVGLQRARNASSPAGGPAEEPNP